MRRVGGAHRGLDMFLLQRASALYMLLFLPLFLIALMACGPFDYLTWRALFQAVGMKVVVLLFVVSVLVHGWIGVREIVIDYVHCARCVVARLALYFVFAVLYLGCLVWTIDILWSVK
jgi:succinate dehydrogenase / fumarate reductase, membrane anchor subunit